MLAHIPAPWILWVMFSHAFSMISPTKNGSIGHGLQVYVGPDEGYVQEQGDRAMNSD